MKETRNLAQIIKRRRLHQLPLLDFETDKKSKENDFVAALFDERDVTQTHLLRSLYEQPSSKNQTAFRQMHFRVAGKLLNHLYFLDHSDARYSISRRYQLQCLDLLHKGTILYLEGDLALAARLCNQCLALAVADGFTSYGIEAAQQLRTIYTETQQHKLFHVVVKELERLQALRRLEEQAEALYAEVRLTLMGSISSRHTVVDTLVLSLERLRQIHLLAQSPNTAELYYKLHLIFLEQTGDYLGVIEFCKEYERRLAAGEFNAHRFDKRFNFIMEIYSCLLTQQPEKGLAAVEESEKYFHPTSLNWQYLREHHMVLALHANEFDLARRVLDMARANPTFKRQSPKAQQRWDLYSAYLDFVHPMAKISAARRRELDRLALVMPDSSRDKRGLNVAILIGQVLHFLREADGDAVVLRIESLRKYRLRYLREPTHQRTRLFLRLLELIADEQFEPNRCNARAAPFLKQLANMLPPKTAFGDVEIIPYPALWAIIMQHLRTFTPSLRPEPPAQVDAVRQPELCV